MEFSGGSPYTISVNTDRILILVNPSSLGWHETQLQELRTDYGRIKEEIEELKVSKPTQRFPECARESGWVVAADRQGRFLVRILD